MSKALINKGIATSRSLVVTQGLRIPDTSSKVTIPVTGGKMDTSDFTLSVIIGLNNTTPGSVILLLSGALQITTQANGVLNVGGINVNVGIGNTALITAVSKYNRLTVYLNGNKVGIRNQEYPIINKLDITLSSSGGNYVDFSNLILLGYGISEDEVKEHNDNIAGTIAVSEYGFTSDFLKAPNETRVYCPMNEHGNYLLDYAGDRDISSESSSYIDFLSPEVDNGATVISKSPELKIDTSGVSGQFTVTLYSTGATPNTNYLEAFSVDGGGLLSVTRANGSKTANKETMIGHNGEDTPVRFINNVPGNILTWFFVTIDAKGRNEVILRNHNKYTAKNAILIGNYRPQVSRLSVSGKTSFLPTINYTVDRYSRLSKYNPDCYIGKKYSYIELSDPIDILEKNSYSLELYIKIKDSGKDKNILYFKNGKEIKFKNNRLTLPDKINNNEFQFSSIPTDKFVHLIYTMEMVKKNVYYREYIDGVLIKTYEYPATDVLLSPEEITHLFRGVDDNDIKVKKYRLYVGKVFNNVDVLRYRTAVLADSEKIDDNTALNIDEMQQSYDEYGNSVIKDLEHKTAIIDYNNRSIDLLPNSEIDLTDFTRRTSNVSFGLKIYDLNQSGKLMDMGKLELHIEGDKLQFKLSGSNIIDKIPLKSPSFHIAMIPTIDGLSIFVNGQKLENKIPINRHTNDSYIRFINYTMKLIQLRDILITSPNSDENKYNTRDDLVDIVDTRAINPFVDNDINTAYIPYADKANQHLLIYTNKPLDRAKAYTPDEIKDFMTLSGSADTIRTTLTGVKVKATTDGKVEIDVSKIIKNGLVIIRAKGETSHGLLMRYDFIDIDSKNMYDTDEPIVLGMNQPQRELTKLYLYLNKISEVEIEISYIETDNVLVTYNNVVLPRRRKSNFGRSINLVEQTKDSIIKNLKAGRYSSIDKLDSPTKLVPNIHLDSHKGYTLEFYLLETYSQFGSGDTLLIDAENGVGVDIFSNTITLRFDTLHLYGSMNRLTYSIPLNNDNSYTHIAFTIKIIEGKTICNMYRDGVLYKSDNVYSSTNMDMHINRLISRGNQSNTNMEVASIKLHKSVLTPGEILRNCKSLKKKFVKPNRKLLLDYHHFKLKNGDKNNRYITNYGDSTVNGYPGMGVRKKINNIETISKTLNLDSKKLLISFIADFSEALNIIAMTGPFKLSPNSNGNLYINGNSVGAVDFSYPRLFIFVFNKDNMIEVYVDNKPVGVVSSAVFDGTITYNIKNSSNNNNFYISNLIIANIELSSIARHKLMDNPEEFLNIRHNMLHSDYIKVGGVLSYMPLTEQSNYHIDYATRYYEVDRLQASVVDSGGSVIESNIGNKFKFKFGSAGFNSVARKILFKVPATINNNLLFVYKTNIDGLNRIDIGDTEVVNNAILTTDVDNILSSGIRSFCTTKSNTGETYVKFQFLTTEEDIEIEFLSIRGIGNVESGKINIADKINDTKLKQYIQPYNYIRTEDGLLNNYIPSTFVSTNNNRINLEDSITVVDKYSGDISIEFYIKASLEDTVNILSFDKNEMTLKNGVLTYPDINTSGTLNKSSDIPLDGYTHVVVNIIGNVVNPVQEVYVNKVLVKNNVVGSDTDVTNRTVMLKSILGMVSSIQSYIEIKELRVFTGTKLSTTDINAYYNTVSKIDREIDLSSSSNKPSILLYDNPFYRANKESILLNKGKSSGIFKVKQAMHKLKYGEGLSYKITIPTNNSTIAVSRYLSFRFLKYPNYGIIWRMYLSSNKGIVLVKIDGHLELHEVTDTKISTANELNEFTGNTMLATITDTKVYCIMVDAINGKIHINKEYIYTGFTNIDVAGATCRLGYKLDTIDKTLNYELGLMNEIIQNSTIPDDVKNVYVDDPFSLVQENKNGSYRYPSLPMINVVKYTIFNRPTIYSNIKSYVKIGRLFYGTPISNSGVNTDYELLDNNIDKYKILSASGGTAIISATSEITRVRVKKTVQGATVKNEKRLYVLTIESDSTYGLDVLVNTENTFDVDNLKYIAKGLNTSGNALEFYLSDLSDLVLSVRGNDTVRFNLVALEDLGLYFDVTKNVDRDNLFNYTEFDNEIFYNYPLINSATSSTLSSIKSVSEKTPSNVLKLYGKMELSGNSNDIIQINPKNGFALEVTFSYTESNIVDVEMFDYGQKIKIKDNELYINDSKTSYTTNIEPGIHHIGFIYDPERFVYNTLLNGELILTNNGEDKNNKMFNKIFKGLSERSTLNIHSMQVINDRVTISEMKRRYMTSIENLISNESEDSAGTIYGINDESILNISDNASTSIEMTKFISSEKYIRSDDNKFTLRMYGSSPKIKNNLLHIVEDFEDSGAILFSVVQSSIGKVGLTFFELFDNNVSILKYYNKNSSNRALIIYGNEILLPRFLAGINMVLSWLNGKMVLLCNGEVQTIIDYSKPIKANRLEVFRGCANNIFSYLLIQSTPAIKEQVDALNVDPLKIVYRNKHNDIVSMVDKKYLKQLYTFTELSGVYYNQLLNHNFNYHYFKVESISDPGLKITINEQYLKYNLISRARYPSAVIVNKLPLKKNTDYILDIVPTNLNSIGSSNLTIDFLEPNNSNPTTIGGNASSLGRLHVTVRSDSNGNVKIALNSNKYFANKGTGYFVFRLRELPTEPKTFAKLEKTNYSYIKSRNNNLMIPGRLKHYDHYTDVTMGYIENTMTFGKDTAVNITGSRPVYGRYNQSYTLEYVIDLPRISADNSNIVLLATSNGTSRFEIANYGVSMGVNTYGSSNVGVVDSLLDGGRHHIVMAVKKINASNTKITLYVDGIEEKSITQPTEIEQYTSQYPIASVGNNKIRIPVHLYRCIYANVTAEEVKNRYRTLKEDYELR